MCPPYDKNVKQTMKKFKYVFENYNKIVAMLIL